MNINTPNVGLYKNLLIYLYKEIFFNIFLIVLYKCPHYGLIQYL